MRLVTLSFLGVLISLAPAMAQQADEATAAAQAFESELGYQTGTITLPNDIATIKVPADFRFLPKEGSQRLLTEAWGNPAEMSENVLGMLIPADTSPLSDDGWGIVITFDESGYVNDGDAASINYDKLLKEMQDETKSANKERQRLGFEPVTLVGWAEPPHYDAANHKLFWAKELQFGSESVHTLNYCIRILGRRGVLELNAVSALDKLATIHEDTPNVLASIDFNEGHRYGDFSNGDKVAKYGLAALIAGTAAAKVGFFKALLVAILAMKKLLVVAVVALIAFVRKLFTARRQRTPAQQTS